MIAAAWVVLRLNLNFGQIEMKRGFTTYCLLILLLNAVVPDLRSQEVDSVLKGERIEAFTDRTIYVSGEKIRFSVYVDFIDNLIPKYTSRIIYCELITPTGVRITGGKYLLNQHTGDGALTIPSEVISGNYYLKFYTRQMRNCGPDCYTFLGIKIINTYKTDVLSGNTSSSDTTEPSSKSIMNAIGDSGARIICRKHTFHPREEVTLNIKGTFSDKTALRMTLTVVPEFTFRDSTTFTPNHHGNDSGGYWVKETRGISLTGKLLAKESGKPLPDFRINLSIIGDKDFLAMNTDSSGRFFFSLPDYSGNRDIFLSTASLHGISPEIFIDNDFCSKPITLPFIPFSLNKEEKMAAYKLAVNQIVTASFETDSLLPVVAGPASKVPFYGNPTNVIDMQKYIDLPTLREYFTELPVIVRIKKSDEKQQFRFYLAEGEMSVYNPLVLVDWVVVEDIEKILAMPPDEIERVELVSAVYIKGSITYGGIISFFSKKNDFAGIDLPASGTFINYGFIEPAPDSIKQGSLRPTIPDSRNTIYWDPAFQTDGEGSAMVKFTAPDTPGRYHILLRAIMETGKVVVTVAMIEVK